MTQLSLAELSLLPTQGAASDSPDLRRKGNYSRGWRSVPRWLPKEEPPVLSCEWKDGSQATVQWVGVPRRIQGGRVRGRDVSCPGVASVEVHCPPPPAGLRGHRLLGKAGPGPHQAHTRPSPMYGRVAGAVRSGVTCPQMHNFASYALASCPPVPGQGSTRGCGHAPAMDDFSTSWALLRGRRRPPHPVVPSACHSTQHAGSV